LHCFLPINTIREHEMIIRKSATTMDDNDWNNFAKALVLMKAEILNPTANRDDQINVYDLFDAIHVGIRRVRTPNGGTTNMGHRTAGFCPWHREFILRFEKEMQKRVPSSFLPYWDWTDHQGTTNLFVKEKLGERTGPIISGYFAHDAPGTGSNTLPRPAWWPPALEGWRIPRQLQFMMGQGLYRTYDSRELATADHIDVVKKTDAYEGGPQLRWVEPGTGRIIMLSGGFRKRLEGGSGGVPRTHNFGHGWTGGQMGDPKTSPLDPIFFLHHCNIDRIWNEWQVDDGHAGINFYPASGFDQGHNLKDSMWPWVGAALGYTSLTSPAGIPWPDFSAEDPVTPEDVIDITTLRYKYA